MKLNELKSILELHPDKFPRFILPDGDQVPAHFHLTEVGHVAKNFIDCGGTIRKTESSVLQLWVNDGDPIPVTNAVGFWQITRPAQKGATYRELWIAPDGSGSLASREIKLT